MTDLPMAEMVRRACAEVGAPCRTVRDSLVTSTGQPSVQWASSEETPELAKASYLAILRVYGPSDRVRCHEHLRVGTKCDTITVYEALRYPALTCGGPA